jgi:hypothetical protein
MGKAQQSHHAVGHVGGVEPKGRRALVHSRPRQLHLTQALQSSWGVTHSLAPWGEDGQQISSRRLDCDATA